MELVKIPSTFEKVVGARSHLPAALEFEGYKWLLGTGRGEYPINTEDLVRYYPLVVKKALTMSQSESVTISLPSELYFEDSIAGQELINLIVDRIVKENGIKEVVVLPQGIIALQKVFKEGYLERDLTLVVDGGFNTINVAIVDKHGATVYVKSYYNELGIRDFLEQYFLPEIKRRYPEIPKHLQLLKDVFLTGTIDKGFQKIDISEEKTNALHLYIDSLFGRLRKDIERENKRFNQFAVVGGLSYYLSQIELETNKRYFIPQVYGEYYTAMGMLAYMPSLAVDFGFGDIKIAY